MSTKEAYRQKLQTQWDEWKAEIDTLKAKAAKAEAEAQITYNKQIEEPKAKQEEIKEKLEELRQAGEDTWENLKGGIEKAWHKVGDVVSSAVSRFK